MYNEAVITMKNLSLQLSPREVQNVSSAVIVIMFAPIVLAKNLFAIIVKRLVIPHTCVV